MGVAIYKIKKTQLSMYSYQEAFQSGYVDLHDLMFVLSQMPPNTSIAHIKLLPIVGLFREFEIGLYNKIFKDGVEITDNSKYMRDIGFTSSGEMIPYNRNTDFNLKEVVRQHGEVEEDADDNRL